MSANHLGTLTVGEAMGSDLWAVTSLPPSSTSSRPLMLLPVAPLDRAIRQSEPLQRVQGALPSVLPAEARQHAMYICGETGDAATMIRCDGPACGQEVRCEVLRLHILVGLHLQWLTIVCLLL